MVINNEYEHQIVDCVVKLLEEQFPIMGSVEYEALVYFTRRLDWYEDERDK